MFVAKSSIFEVATINVQFFYNILVFVYQNSPIRVASVMKADDAFWVDQGLMRFEKNFITKICQKIRLILEPNSWKPIAKSMLLVEIWAEIPFCLTDSWFPTRIRVHADWSNSNFSFKVCSAKRYINKFLKCFIRLVSRWVIKWK